MSDWWEEYVYLRSRAPLVVNSNYYVMVRDDPGTGKMGEVPEEQSGSSFRAAEILRI